MKTKRAFGIVLLLSFAFTAKAMVVKNKIEKGKVHLSSIVSAVTGKCYCFVHKDEPGNSTVPILRMFEYMAGTQIHDVKKFQPLAKKYFCKRWSGLEDSVEDSRILVNKEKGIKKGGPTWAYMLIKLVGDLNFGIPQGTDYRHDCFYFPVQKKCLKTEWEKMSKTVEDSVENKPLHLKCLIGEDKEENKQ